MAYEGARRPPHSQFDSTGEEFGCVDATALLSVVVQRLDHDVAVIHVAGEVDMATGPLLENHLQTVLATQPDQLIIDLSQVSFMGSTALSVLVSARRVAVRQSTTVQLRGTQRRAVAARCKSPASTNYSTRHERFWVFRSGTQTVIMRLGHIRWRAACLGLYPPSPVACRSPFHVRRLRPRGSGCAGIRSGL